MFRFKDTKNAESFRAIINMYKTKNIKHKKAMTHN